jgi:HlyD family secretion protein
VVTYDTVIEFDNPDMKLFPGMTAYVTIPVANADDVVKVPNGGLRFTPDLKPEEIRQLYAKYGIRSGTGRQRQAAGDQQAKAAPNASDMAVLWKQTGDRKLEPVQVKTGITDHTFTEVAQVTAGSLNPGDQIVVGSGTANQTQRAGGGQMMRGAGMPR